MFFSCYSLSTAPAFVTAMWIHKLVPGNSALLPRISLRKFTQGVSLFYKQVRYVISWEGTLISYLVELVFLGTLITLWVRRRVVIRYLLFCSDKSVNLSACCSNDEDVDPPNAITSTY